MLYLIQTNLWLMFLTAAFAACGGWIWSTMRAQPKEETLKRERDRLMREVLNTAGDGEGVTAAPGGNDHEMDTLRRRADLDAARITEMERALEGARSRADEAASRAAEAERKLEGAGADQEELTRLRTLAVAAPQETHAIVVDAPSVDEEREGQRWRLRYFEQRVRYLENQANATPVAVAALPPPSAPTPEAPTSVEGAAHDALRLDWRARYAEARARHLEDALRATSATPAAEPEPADDLTRWRMLYLEKRVAHLQAAPAGADPTRLADLETEADRLKWRTHYLESRLRQFEAQPVATAEAAPVEAAAPEPVMQAVEEPQPVEETPAPLVPAGSEERPPSMAAPRGGAGDDFTLIDGVSPMMQSTLNSLGVYHFEQVAAWSPANIAWVDQYLRLRGRIAAEEWLEQAADLAREGPVARRVLEEEMA